MKNRSILILAAGVGLTLIGCSPKDQPADSFAPMSGNSSSGLKGGVESSTVAAPADSQPGTKEGR